MRNALFSKLSEMAIKDKRIWAVTADMGWKIFDKFPQDRYVNVGVAEQNMIGVATGLALCGCIPYCYSISTFLIFRSYEFIRNDIAYQNLPVRIIGVAGDNEYPYYGISHNCQNCEDVDVIRILPNFKIIDTNEKNIIPEILEKTLNDPQPIYFRIRRK